MVLGREDADAVLLGDPLDPAPAQTGLGTLAGRAGVGADQDLHDSHSSATAAWRSNRRAM